MPMWQDGSEVVMVALGSPAFTHLCNSLSVWAFCFSFPPGLLLFTLD